MRALRHIAVLAALGTLGCPGFETDYSGTYHQVLPADMPEEERPSELIGIDVFRYGDTVDTVVRFYENDDGEDAAEPFTAEDRCFSVEPAELDDELKFEARFNDGLTVTRMNGRLQNEDELLARFNTINDNEDILFQRVAVQPVQRCDTIVGKRMTADFAGRSKANEFDEGVYEIREPYFGVQWLSVLTEKRGAVTVYAPQNPDPLASPITSNMTENRRGLRGALSLQLEPPDEKFQTLSGATYYSVAHFIVIDDDPDDDGEFRWDDETEPIIAAGVRPGTRADAPKGKDGEPIEHNAFGKAVFFVRGNLLDLDPELLDNIENVDEVAPDEHFYIVDVYALDNRVKAMRIDDEADGDIGVVITDGWLDETGMPLPRVFPN